MFDEAKLQKLVEDLVQSATDRLVQRLLRHEKRILKAHRARKSAFEGRLHERWARAIDLYELTLYLSGRIGKYVSQLRPQISSEFADKTYVLLRLHGNGVRTAAEVLLLLKGGFASGAHARWRSLHETSVIALFISEEPKDTARRFIDHRHVKALEDAEQYQKHAHRLKAAPLSDEELKELRDAFDSVIAKYGVEFKGGFGWAKEALLRRNKNRKGTVIFGELEQAVGNEFWVPYFRLASHAIHPSATSIWYNIGSVLQDTIILAGPTNAGLADPGHGALLSLNKLNMSLLTLVQETSADNEPVKSSARQDEESLEPSAEKILMNAVLSNERQLSFAATVRCADMLAKMAGDAFLEAHNQLEHEEMQKAEARARA